MFEILYYLVIRIKLFLLRLRWRCLLRSLLLRLLGSRSRFVLLVLIEGIGWSWVLLRSSILLRSLFLSFFFFWFFFFGFFFLGGFHNHDNNTIVVFYLTLLQSFLVLQMFSARNQFLLIWSYFEMILNFLL